MERYRGTGIGSGAAMGRAVVLRLPGGVPDMPASMLPEIMRARRGEPMEPMDAVAVAGTYALAAALSVPWARVVAMVVAGQPEAPAPAPGVPVVVLDDLLTSIADNDLLLVDADRGIVLVDIDGATVAAFQAERERISPRRRLFIGRAHEPARMLDGREVRVLGLATDLGEVDAAVRAGADGLLVPPDSRLVPAEASDEEQLDAVQALIAAAGSTPITLVGDAHALSAGALLRAAAASDLTLAVPLSSDAAEAAQVEAWVAEARAELLAEGAQYGVLRLAACVAPLEPVPEELDGIVRLIVLGAPGQESGDPAWREWLAEVCARAAVVLVPVEVALGAGDGELPAAVALGAAGAIVEPERIQATKERVRSLDREACRELLRGPDGGPA